MILSAVAAALGLSGNPVQAAVITWSGTASTNFGTGGAGGNWSGAAAPNSTSTVTFTGTPTANQPTLFANQSVAGVNFASAGWTIDGGTSPFTLTIGATGIASVGTGTNSITAPVAASTANWAAGTDNTIDVSGAISGSAVITQNGAGMLTLSGSSTVAAASISASSGTLKLNKTASSNTINAAINASGGTVLWAAADQINNGGGITATNGGTLNMAGSNEELNQFVLTGSSIVQGGNTLTLDRTSNSTLGGLDSLASATTSTVSGGTISMHGSIRRIQAADGAAGIDLAISSVLSNGGIDRQSQAAGTGVVQLTNTNTYTGTTTLGTGTTIIDGSIGTTAATTDAVSVNTTPVATFTATSATLGGSGSIFADTTATGVSSAATANIAPGSVDTTTGASTIGTLTIGASAQAANMTFSSNSNLLIDVNTAAAGAKIDLLAVKGNLGLASVDNTDALYLSGTLGATTAGTAYVLATYGGTRSGKFDAVYFNNALIASPEIGGIGSGYKLVYGAATNGDIELVAVPEPTAFLGMATLSVFSLIRRRNKR